MARRLTSAFFLSFALTLALGGLLYAWAQQAATNILRILSLGEAV